MLEKKEYPMIGHVVMSVAEYRDLITELNEATELAREYRNRCWAEKARADKAEELNAVYRADSERLHELKEKLKND